MRMLHKKSTLVFFIIFATVHVLLAQNVILSPTKGVWANYQSLVLNLPASHEAYYSFTGENPLESGFAYDGPVLIEIEGDVSLGVTIVDNNNMSTSHTIMYNVNLQDELDYLPIEEGQATLIVNDTDTIDLPDTARFALTNSTVFSPGERIEISGDMFFERYVLLTLNDGAIPYRYVIQVGDSEKRAQIKPPINESIMITDWNYISFLHEGVTLFSVDGEPLRQTRSGKIYVDRSEDHELKWKRDIGDEFNTLLLPRQPEVIGIPSSPSVNNPVNIALSDSRYMFGYDITAIQTVFTQNFLVDTLKGDAFGFSKELDIYHDGLKHGSVQAAFIIDKIPPSTPVLTTSSTNGYARDDVTITVQASDSVYYYIPPPTSSKVGFLSDEFQSVSKTKFNDKSLYLPLDGDTILLDNNSGLAQLYEVYVFSKDFAGNTSDIVSFKTVVDPYNYYLTNVDSSELITGLGTIDKPFTNFIQLHNVLNNAAFQNIYIDGVFTEISSLSITRDTVMSATTSSRLIFSSGESIRVQNASLSIEGGTIEQSNPSESTSIQNTLLFAQNSTLSLNNSEFIITGGFNSNCIVLENSSAQIFNSGITVQTLAYGSGIKATGSVVLSDGNRFVQASETAIGMSLVDTSTQVNNTSFIGIGPLSRSIEFIESDFSIINSVFKFENSGEKRADEYAAIWLDESTVQSTLSNNTFEGFTNLIITHPIN